MVAVPVGSRKVYGTYEQFRRVGLHDPINYHRDKSPELPLLPKNENRISRPMSAFQLYVSMSGSSAKRELTTTALITAGMMTAAYGTLSNSGPKILSLSGLRVARHGSPQ